MFSTKNEQGFQSTTKWGSLLIGLTFILNSVASAWNGDITWTDGVSDMAISIGAIIGIWGIRDLPIWDSFGS